MPSKNVSILAVQYARVVVSLPEPPETFQFSDVEMSRGMHARFRQGGVTEKVARCDGRDDTFEWRVTREAYDAAEAHLDEKNGFSCCGARGVTNDGGDLYCIKCGAAVSRDEFERVMC